MVREDPPEERHQNIRRYEQGMQTSPIGVVVVAGDFATGSAFATIGDFAAGGEFAAAAGACSDGERLLDQAWI